MKKKKNWNRIESYIEGITMNLDDLENGEITKTAAISHIRSFTDDIYTVCEDDHCDSCNDDISSEYEEIIAILPDAKLSLAETLSLKETIQKWRDEHGYPNP